MKHYQIRKRVVCDIIEGECVEEQDITTSIKPDCNKCHIYFNWKQSGLSINDFVKQNSVKIEKGNVYASS